jgi:hypothetical protein
MVFSIAEFRSEASKQVTLSSKKVSNSPLYGSSSIPLPSEKEIGELIKIAICR